MDPAIIGSCRVGHFRIGVKRADWDNAVLAKLKKVSARSMGGIDPCVAGGFRAGRFRAGVYLPLFDKAKEAIKKRAT